MSDESVQNNDAPELSAEDRNEAISMGWVDKPDFKGDISQWVDAKTFIEKGRTVLPYVKATNERLRTDLNQTTRQLSEVQAQLKATNAALAAIQEESAERTAEEIVETRERLEAQYRKAREDNDVDTELKVSRSLRELETAEKEAEARKKAGTKVSSDSMQSFQKPAEYLAWEAKNDWLGRDESKSELALTLGRAIKREQPNLVGKAFFDELDVRLTKFYGSGERRPSKTEGGNGSGTQTRVGKGFADLPPEAQEACMRMAKRVVGNGKRHKDNSSWQAAYAATYFAMEK